MSLYDEHELVLLQDGYKRLRAKKEMAIAIFPLKSELDGLKIFILLRKREKFSKPARLRAAASKIRRTIPGLNVAKGVFGSVQYDGDRIIMTVESGDPSQVPQLTIQLKAFADKASAKQKLVLFKRLHFHDTGGSALEELAPEAMDEATELQWLRDIEAWDESVVDATAVAAAERLEDQDVDELLGLLNTEDVSDREVGWMQMAVGDDFLDALFFLDEAVDDVAGQLRKLANTLMSEKYSTHPKHEALARIAAGPLLSLDHAVEVAAIHTYLERLPTASDPVGVLDEVAAVLTRFIGSVNQDLRVQAIDTEDFGVPMSIAVTLCGAARRCSTLVAGAKKSLLSQAARL